MRIFSLLSAPNVRRVGWIPDSRGLGHICFQLSGSHVEWGCCGTDLSAVDAFGELRLYAARKLAEDDAQLVGLTLLGQRARPHGSKRIAQTRLVSFLPRSPKQEVINEALMSRRAVGVG